MLDWPPRVRWKIIGKRARGSEKPLACAWKREVLAHGYARFRKACKTVVCVLAGASRESSRNFGFGDGRRAPFSISSCGTWFPRRHGLSGPYEGRRRERRWRHDPSALLRPYLHLRLRSGPGRVGGVRTRGTGRPPKKIGRWPGVRAAHGAVWAPCGRHVNPHCSFALDGILWWLRLSSLSRIDQGVPCTIRCPDVRL